jgi:4-hydroxyacetophenone monooxygenase
MTSHGVDAYPPITADDETLHDALDAAHIPSLMCALVHLTGDMSHVRGTIRPTSTLFADPQGGISAEDQATVRELAFDLLRAFRDAGSRLPAPPTADEVGEMSSFIIGEQVPPEYEEFLLSELAMDGQDPYARASFQGIDEQARRDFHVVIVGAGMSGLLAAIRLDGEGIPYTIVEKNAEVGGTWHQNQYPGCRVDNPNHIYSYSFEPQDWPQYYSDRRVLFEYFDRVADKYGIRDHIRFNTEVESAVFNDETGGWTVTVTGADGASDEIEARAVISAVGQLNRPRLPQIAGRDSFEGISFHSGEWEHEHDLSGKRIGVVGTGASAFQFVPEIASEADEVVIFQRTPPWMAPTPTYRQEIPEGKHWLLQHVPFYDKWYRFSLFWRTSEGMLRSVTVDPDWDLEQGSVSEMNHQLRELLTAYIGGTLAEAPEVLANAIPDYPPGGKRMVIDDGNWLRALMRDNVHVVTDPIEAITPAGIRTEGGLEEAFDFIIFATGFQASEFLMPMRVVGRDGVELHDHWDGTARAYMGITIPGFPNLFCLYGPNTNIVVNGSTIFFAECEMRYIMGCLRLLLDGGHAAMDCKVDVHDEYNRRIDEGNAAMAWGTPNVSSWYKNASGHVTQNWPFTLLEFWTQTRAPDPDDYEFLEVRVLAGVG